MPNKKTFSLKNHLKTGVLLAITTVNALNPILTILPVAELGQKIEDTSAKLATAKESVLQASDSLFFATAEASFTPSVPNGSGTNYVTNEIVQGGTQTVLNGGTTGYIQVNSNGVQDIKNGGSALSTQVNYYGIQYIHSNGLAIGTDVYSGGEQIIDGGSTADTTLHDGARQLIIDGTAQNTQIYGAIQSIFITGMANNTDIYEGGQQRVLEGGQAVSTQVHSGGIQVVDYSGSVKNTVVNNGGIQYVNSGGSSEAVTINNGGLSILASGAQITGSILNEGILDVSKYNNNNLIITGNVGKVILYELGRPTQKQLTIQSLSGLQTFAISADLANNKADKVSIINADGTHYIKVLRELTDGSDLADIKGHSATVAEITNGNVDFQGATSAIDGVNVKAIIEQDNNKWNLIGYQIIGPSNLSITDIAGADMAYAALLSSRDNLQQRLAELRNNDNHSGVWARIYGGEYAVNASSMNYSTIQGGYDWTNKQSGGKTATGLTIEYLNADNSYLAGSGKTNNTLFGAYHAWFGNRGHYYDIVAKTGRLHNEITVYGEETIKGSYDVSNMIISAEYGYRKNLANGYFITPQIAIQYGRINAVNYTTDSNTLVRQDAINSWISRIGLTLGHARDNHEVYLSANWLHEFSAKSRVATGRTRNAYTLEDDFRGDYIELALGGSVKINRNSMMYLDAARSFGGNITNKWRLQAGYRYSF